MFRNLFRSLVYYFMVSVLTYAFAGEAIIQFENHGLAYWTSIPEIIILIIMIYTFYYVGRYWLDPLGNMILNGLSLSLIPLIGLIIAFANFLYRYHGHNDVHPFVFFNMAYTLPLWAIFESGPALQDNLWKEFIILWGLTFIPPVIMWSGLWASSHETRNG